MILYTSRARALIITLILMVSGIGNVHSQLIQDTTTVEQSAKFAEYLASLQLHDLAAQEYERLVYLEPNEPKYIDGLIRSYGLSNQGALLKRRMQSYPINDGNLLDSHINALLINDMPHDANRLYARYHNLPNPAMDQSIRFKLSIANRDWESAYKIYQTKDPIDLSTYSDLLNQANRIKYKSLVLAGILSAVVPGTGRFYSEDYIDGLISVLFIASAGFQAYRRFRSNGIQSTGGWIYGGIALGFYISNIYGSVQAAKYYNHQKDQKLYEEAMAIIRSGM